MALRAKKYFQDHVTETVLENGREVTKLVYRGNLYCRNVSPRWRVIEGVVYVLLALLGGVALLTAMAQNVENNMGGIFAGISLLCLVPAFCLLEGAAEALFRRGDLKKTNYRERLFMLRIAPLAGCLLNLALCIGYFADAAAGASAAENMIAGVCTLFNAVISGAVALREQKVTYTVKPGINTPEG